MKLNRPHNEAPAGAAQDVVNLLADKAKVLITVHAKAGDKNKLLKTMFYRLPKPEISILGGRYSLLEGSC